MQTFLSNPSYRNFIDNTSLPSQPFTKDSINKEVEVGKESVKDSIRGEVTVKGEIVTTKIILENNLRMSEVEDKTEHMRFERESSNSNGNGNGNGTKTNLILEARQRYETESKTDIETLTETLMAARQRFEHEKGAINSANITIFSIWVCDQYKPKWFTMDRTECGFFEPSGIKGIASKMFGLTPDPKPAD
jgi:hypothetical protein